MKKLILAVIVSGCFTGNLLAQHIKVVNATGQAWEGGAAPMKGYPYPGGVHYNIALSCESFNSIVLDSVYIHNTKTKLIINRNVNVDSLNHIYFIHIESNNSNQNPPAISDTSEKTTRHFNGEGLIVYEYKGIKYTLLIEKLTNLLVDHHS